MSSASKRPEVPDGYLGPQPKFEELGMTAVSHTDSEIRLGTDNTMEIKFKAPKPIKVTSNLINATVDKEFPEYVFTQTYENTIHFVLNFPDPGFYKFQIYALEADNDSKSLPNAFNYLINVVNAIRTVLPFPKQYAQWKEGCSLTEPLNINPESRLTRTKFKCVIPKAKAVAVVSDGEWYPLAKKDGHWEGVVNLDKHKGNKATLNANLDPNDDSKYSTLLEYQL